MSMLRLDMVTVVVPDYDEALAYYVGALGFSVVEDKMVSDGKRWVVVDPGGGSRLLLAVPADAEQASAIGRQAGGRVGFFLGTRDFAASHRNMLDRGVNFEEAPRREDYGIVAVFRDPFGNRWDLIEPSGEAAR